MLCQTYTEVEEALGTQAECLLVRLFARRGSCVTNGSVAEVELVLQEYMNWRASEGGVFNSGCHFMSSLTSDRTEI